MGEEEEKSSSASQMINLRSSASRSQDIERAYSSDIGISRGSAPKVPSVNESNCSRIRRLLSVGASRAVILVGSKISQNERRLSQMTDIMPNFL
jgi:hypothetical protein